MKTTIIWAVIHCILIPILSNYSLAEFKPTNDQIELLNKAYLEYKKDNYDQAITICQDIINRYPNNYVAYMAREQIIKNLNKQGKTTEATESLNELIAILNRDIENEKSWQSASARVFLSRSIYFPKRQYEKAIEVMLGILDYNLADFKGKEEERNWFYNSAFNTIGQVYINTEKWEELEEWVSTWPDGYNTDKFYMENELSQHYRATSNWKKIAEFIEKYQAHQGMKLTPSEYYNLLIYEKEREGKIREVIEIIKSIPKPEEWQLIKLEELEERVKSQEDIQEPSTGIDEEIIAPEEARDSSERYREVYSLIREGRQALQEKNIDKARTTIKSAQSLLQTIKNDDPEWNPGAVKARLLECENLLNTPIKSE